MDRVRLHLELARCIVPRNEVLTGFINGEEGKVEYARWSLLKASHYQSFNTAHRVASYSYMDKGDHYTMPIEIIEN